jgi:hypothetical protein
LSYLLVIFSILIFASASVSDKLLFIDDASVIFSDSLISSRSDSYTNEDIYHERQHQIANVNWYVSLRGDLIFYFLIFIFLLELVGIIKLPQNVFINRCWPFCIIFFCLTLLTFNLGSIGRFMYIFYLISLVRLYSAISICPWHRGLRVIALLSVPILLLHVLVTARAGFYFVDPSVLFANAVTMFFLEHDVSLSELLIGH